MRRKVISQGNNAFTTTLPVKWIRKNHIKNEIDIEESNNELIIRPVGKETSVISRTSIDLKDYSRRIIMNLIYQAYRKGFDEIKLNYNKKEQMVYIKEITKHLIGFEIAEEERSFCTIQNMAEPSPNNFDMILRKVFQMIKQESSDMYSDIRSKESQIDKYKEMSIDIRRYCNYLRRVIVKNSIGGNRDSYLLFSLSSYLSYIHQAYYNLYLEWSKNRTTIDKDLLYQLRSINGLFEDLYYSFYKRKMDLNNHIIDKKKDVLDYEIYNLLKKKQGFENIMLYHMGEITRLIQYASLAIIGTLEKEY